MDTPLLDTSLTHQEISDALTITPGILEFFKREDIHKSDLLKKKDSTKFDELLDLVSYKIPATVEILMVVEDSSQFNKLLDKTKLFSLYDKCLNRIKSYSPQVKIDSERKTDIKKFDEDLVGQYGKRVAYLAMRYAEAIKEQKTSLVYIKANMVDDNKDPIALDVEQMFLSIGLYSNTALDKLHAQMAKDWPVPTETNNDLLQEAIAATAKIKNLPAGSTNTTDVTSIPTKAVPSPKAKVTRVSATRIVP